MTAHVVVVIIAVDLMVAIIVIDVVVVKTISHIIVFVVPVTHTHTG